MNKNVNRWIIYILSINILALGIILNTRTDLGVAAFTNLFYAFSKVNNISLGTASIILYLILIIVQICLVRKLTITIFLEIPFSLIFGYISDFKFIICLSTITDCNYFCFTWSILFS